MFNITMLKKSNCFMPKLWLNVFKFSTRVSSVVATCKCHFYTIILIIQNREMFIYIYKFNVLW